MIYQLLFYYKIFFIVLLYAYRIQCQSLSILSPGCSLVQTKIYCFGGYSVVNSNQLIPSNSHISLDLAKFNNFTTFDKNIIQWTVASNLLADGSSTLQPRSFAASAPAYSDNSFLIYGGISTTENPSDPPISNPFANYLPSSNNWRSLNLPPGGNFTSRASIVNLGNDTFWIWGGQAQSTHNYSPNILYLYDYRTSQWLNQINSNWAMRIQHTATLANNNVIYIFGGAYKINDSSFAYANFNQAIGFNTQTLFWSNITAGGDLPKSRVSHTTTQIPGKNLLFIYGGVNAFKEPDLLADSLCFTYDYVENRFTLVQIPKNPFNSVSTLYGHYATSFADSFIVFAFGLVDSKLPAFSLSVLNITDPYNSRWVVDSLPVSNTSSNGTSNGTSDGTSGYNGDGLNTSTIAAITVPIVVAFLGCIIGIFAFLRYKSKKQTKPVNDFELEDPRRALDRKDQFEFSGTGSEKEKKKELEEMKRCKPSEIDSIKPDQVSVTKPTEFIDPFNNNNASFTTITASTVVHTHSFTRD